MSVIKLALAVARVHTDIDICRKKWKVFKISIKLINEKLQRRNWCNLITQRIGYRPLWAGRMGEILSALGTDQIAGFVEYRPLTNWGKRWRKLRPKYNISKIKIHKQNLKRFVTYDRWLRQKVNSCSDKIKTSSDEKYHA